MSSSVWQVHPRRVRSATLGQSTALTKLSGTKRHRVVSLRPGLACRRNDTGERLTPKGCQSTGRGEAPAKGCNPQGSPERATERQALSHLRRYAYGRLSSRGFTPACNLLPLQGIVKFRHHVATICCSAFCPPPRALTPKGFQSTGRGEAPAK